MRPACWAEASSSTPTSSPGLGRSAYRWSLIVARPGGRGSQTDHDAHARGLARSVGPQEAGHPACFSLEADVVDGREAGVLLRK